MKRILLVGGAVVGLLIVAIGILLAVTFMGRIPVPGEFEIEGIRIVAEGFGSVAIVPTGGGRVALIDAGNDPMGTVILEELASRGLGPDAVEAILLTHGHPDHIGAVRIFPDAEVMALETEVPLIEGRVAPGSPIFQYFPPTPTGIAVTRPLRDGEVVTLGDTTIRVFAVPGHTSGSAAYLVNGVLFLGDSVSAGSDGGLVGSPWLFSDDRSQNQTSLAELYDRLRRENVPVRALAFAHSAALVEGLEPLARYVQEN